MSNNCWENSKKL